MNVSRPSSFQVVAILCLMGTLALADVPPAKGTDQKGPYPALDHRRADEWQRREVLESQHGRRPPEANSMGTLELIAIPVLILILVLGIMRVKDF